MLTIGIDVGLGGGLALAEWRGDERMPARVTAAPMPVWAAGVRGKRVVDCAALAAWLTPAAVQGGVVMAAYEAVHAMPKQGTVSMFGFGRSLGVVEMALAALGLPHVGVAPERWKRDMAVPRDKAAARQMAAKLLPGFAHQWARAKDDGVAEAALLALWAAWHGMGGKHGGNG
jgi:hypothetical protein